MPLSQEKINIFDNSIREYTFPCVCYDFKNDRHLQFDKMSFVEEFIKNDLLSREPSDVKNGLSNVLYWGYANIGYRDRRVEIFRSTVTQGKLSAASALFKKIRGNGLQEIHSLGLPQFSGMSFISKVRMFLDPTEYAILDQQILKMNKAQFATVLKNIKFGEKETQIRISKGNSDVYQKWCERCQGISSSIFNGKYRTVDVERGFFTLIQNDRVELAAEILSKA